jgi:hypothetical protein
MTPSAKTLTTGMRCMSSTVKNYPVKTYGKSGAAAKSG